MTLRGRLTMFFAMIVILPLVAATFGLQALVSREIQRRNETRLQASAQATAALWHDRLREAGREVRFVGAGIGEVLASENVQETLTHAREEAGLDFLVVSADGAIVASSVGAADFLGGIPLPSASQLVQDRATVSVIRAHVDVLDGSRDATVTGGFFADQGLVRALARATNLDVAITSGGRVVASTREPAPEVPREASGLVTLGEEALAYVSPIQGAEGGIVVLGSPEEAGGWSWLLWAIVLAGLLLITGLGYAMANLIARPLQRLADHAMAVAGGNFDARVETDEQGDVARLAQAFNVMTENMKGYVGELRKSRDELRRGLDRLGATLRSTHDLEGMFAVILDTAAVTLGAKAGAVFLLTPSGRELRLEVARGFEPPVGSSLRLGEGIAGRAGAGVGILMPRDEEPVTPSPPMEPAAPTAVAVPLIRGDRTMGVLALYGRTIPEPFVEDDLSTLRSFSAQASVAVENVLLHQEAQRLSITDGLTGVWNRRYLQLTLTKEIERAQRFERPLSILMLDIDHFKRVNDEHGHQLGDEVLVELSRRTMSSIRSQIDSLARYGGEEFVVVLPETPAEGAFVTAEKVLSVIRAHEFAEEEGSGIPITVSIGVASFPDDGTSADELIRAADLALYRAKERGRNRIEVATT